MIQDNFRFYKPCRMLQPFVRFYWAFRSDLRLNTLSFPVGCTQIIFHKRKPLYIPEFCVLQDRLTISGQVNFSSHLCSEGDLEMIVVVFHPHAMSAFLNVPTSLFYNLETSGYNLEDRSLNELSERIFDCDSDEICINLIEDWLLARLAGCKTETLRRIGRIDATVRQILYSPQTTVSDLASVACLGKKQFEREFGSLVGINPKEYARIVRFQKALSLMQNHSCKNVNLAQIAYASGYSDQSHFCREFRKFSGHSPAVLLKDTALHSDLFANPV